MWDGMRKRSLGSVVVSIVLVWCCLVLMMELVAFGSVMSLVALGRGVLCSAWTALSE